MTIPQHCVDDTASVMRAIERHLDDAVVLYGQLFGELVKAQTEGQLHPMAMHDELFARMPALGASLIASRGDAAEVHKGMNRTANKLGLAKSDLSPPEDKTWPPPGSAPPVFARARQSAAAAADGG